MTRTIAKIFLLQLIVLSSCKTRQLRHELQIKEYGLPPGTVEIANNIYIDEIEITNFSYLEFVWWTNRVSGNTEYKSILPDTLSWAQFPEVKCPYCKIEFYLRHPSYRNRPVVGVSYTQALKFCKWRADRVMEYILIKHHIIPHNPNPDKETAFTIEKYFNGNYNNIKPNPFIKYYPEYSLPDSLTYLKSIKFADSLNKVNSKYCGTKNCEDYYFHEDDILKAKDFLTIRCLENIPNRSDSLPFGTNQTKNSYCKNCKRPLLTDLLGNVREMTNIEGVSFGGSFFDSCDTVKSKYFYHSKKETNAYTGFRNICSWKK